MRKYKSDTRPLHIKLIKIKNYNIFVIYNCRLVWQFKYNQWPCQLLKTKPYLLTSHIVPGSYSIISSFIWDWFATGNLMSKEFMRKTKICRKRYQKNYAKMWSCYWPSSNNNLITEYKNWATPEGTIFVGESIVSFNHIIT